MAQAITMRCSDICWRFRGLASPYTLKFAQALSEVRPALAVSVVLVAHDTDDRYGLRITVPPPVGGTGPLYIDAADDEVTLAFDLWEMGYSPELEAVAPELFLAEAIATIDGILDERIAIALAVREDDACIGPGTFQVGDCTPFDHWSHRRVCVRSWRGTLNRGWTLPWPGVE